MPKKRPAPRIFAIGIGIALLIGGGSFDEQDRKLERGADVLLLGTSSGVETIKPR